MSSPEYMREKRRRIAESEGREVREYQKRTTSGDKRARTIERKKQYRVAKAEAEGRIYKPKKFHNSHVREFQRHVAQERIRSEREMKMSKCDAHVRRFLQVVYNREKFRVRYERFKNEERARVSSYKARLPDAYVLQNLALPREAKKNVPTELLNLKRDQLLMRRLALQLKQAAHQAHKENYEAIAKHT